MGPWPLAGGSPGLARGPIILVLIAIVSDEPQTERSSALFAPIGGAQRRLYQYVRRISQGSAVTALGPGPWVPLVGPLVVVGPMGGPLDWGWDPLGCAHGRALGPFGWAMGGSMGPVGGPMGFPMGWVHGMPWVWDPLGWGPA